MALVIRVGIHVVVVLVAIAVVIAAAEMAAAGRAIAAATAVVAAAGPVDSLRLNLPPHLPRHHLPRPQVTPSRGGAITTTCRWAVAVAAVAGKAIRTPALRADATIVAVADGKAIPIRAVRAVETTTAAVGGKAIPIPEARAVATIAVAGGKATTMAIIRTAITATGMIIMAVVGKVTAMMAITAIMTGVIVGGNGAVASGAAAMTVATTAVVVIIATVTMMAAAIITTGGARAVTGTISLTGGKIIAGTAIAACGGASILRRPMGITACRKSITVGIGRPEITCRSIS